MTPTKPTSGWKRLFRLREGTVYQRSEVLVQELEVASHVVFAQMGDCSCLASLVLQKN